MKKFHKNFSGGYNKNGFVKWVQFLKWNCKFQLKNRVKNWIELKYGGWMISKHTIST